MEGRVFHDADQGWEVEIWGHGDELILRQGDPDEGEEHVLARTDRMALARQVAAVVARVERLLVALKAELGADYWSARRSP